MIGELKNPLLNKNTIIPMIGPIPNTNKTNLAEFFVCPNSLLDVLIIFFLLFFNFFFMNNILQQTISYISN